MPIWLSVLLGALSVVAAATSAVAAIFSQRNSARSLEIAKRSFDHQRTKGDPRIQVTVELDKDRSTIICIVIVNTGGSTAYDVQFELDGQLPCRAFGLCADDSRQNKPAVMVEGPLISGIPAIAAGDRRIITWGQYGGLYSALGDKFVRVKATYKNESREIRESLSVLEVKSFWSNDASDRNYLGKMARELEDLRKAVDRVCNGSQPLVVETPAQREERYGRQHELILERRKERHDNDS